VRAFGVRKPVDKNNRALFFSMGFLVVFKLIRVGEKLYHKNGRFSGVSITV